MNPLEQGAAVAEQRTERLMGERRRVRAFRTTPTLTRRVLHSLDKGRLEPMADPVGAMPVGQVISENQMRMQTSVSLEPASEWMGKMPAGDRAAARPVGCRECAAAGRSSSLSTVERSSC